MNFKYKIDYKRSLAVLMLGWLLIIFGLVSCKKLVEVTAPANRVASDIVYGSDATAAASLTGLYTKLAGFGYGSPGALPNISMWAGLSADEFSVWGSANASQINYYKNSLFITLSGSAGTEFWTNIYPVIYPCNAAIEGLNASNSLTPALKQQLLGEAKFLRAFCYFYLVNLYGDVPLVLSTDYTINASLARTPKNQVFQQIIQDLKDAQALMMDGYVKPDALNLYSSAAIAERVRPSKAAATALLARTYLYTNDYVNAEAQASLIINNTGYFSLPSLNNVFLKNSMEAIWQLQPVSSSGNTAEGVEFILTYAPVGVNNSHPIYLSPSLLGSFEVGDQRLVNGNWVNKYTDISGTYYYPYKYKIASTSTGTPSEYTMVLRLGEQYLIRAEARGQQGNISGAALDLNVIRSRAGLTNFTTTSQSALLNTIQHERQVELFSEWGHRWLDLKRTGTVDAVMNTQTLLKGGAWSTTQQLYPIPLADLQKNLNLTQNSGY